jgi:hypothetical protein
MHRCRSSSRADELDLHVIALTDLADFARRGSGNVSAAKSSSCDEQPKYRRLRTGSARSDCIRFASYVAWQFVSSREKNFLGRIQ